MTTLTLLLLYLVSSFLMSPLIGAFMCAGVEERARAYARSRVE